MLKRTSNQRKPETPAKVAFEKDDGIGGAVGSRKGHNEAGWQGECVYDIGEP